MDPLEIAIQAVRYYAETHPRPSQVTQSQAAEMLGLSRPTISKLIRNGILSLNKCGLISITQIDEALMPRS